MGSGSTGVAAIKTDRRFIGVEMEEKYFETAARRLDLACQERGLLMEATIKQSTREAAYGLV